MLVESFGHSVAILVWSTPIISTLGVGNLALLVRNKLFQILLSVVIGFRIFFGARTKANYVLFYFLDFR